MRNGQDSGDGKNGNGSSNGNDSKGGKDQNGGGNNDDGDKGKGSGKHSSDGKKDGDGGSGNPAHSAAQFEKLKTHYQQAEKYGKAEIRELSDGRIRYYGDVTPASKAGEMAGRRVVREWNPSTGLKRTWHETVDHNGMIRQVRPDVKFTAGSKVHYLFDSGGSYLGKW